MAKRIDYNTPTTEQLDQVAFIANRMGHDGTAKRAAASNMTMQQVADLITKSRDYCRRNGISLDLATGSQPATERQVDYIASLIVRHDTEAGFSGLVAGLHTNRKPDMAAIRALTKTEASQVIDSLTENY